MIAALVFGTIIIIVGLGLYLQTTGLIGNFWDILWPFIIIVVGILIIAGGLYGRRRHERRRY
jgi:RsiW-degrading membrane proteinase PrsW (M82 family)